MPREPRVLLDGRLVAETEPIQPNASGHEAVPEVPRAEDPRWREIAAGDQERGRMDLGRGVAQG